MEAAGPMNPYEAPRAELNAPAPGPGLPANIENAVAGGPPGVIGKQISSSVVSALMTPFTAGLYMMCVRRALGQPISFGTAFSYLPRTGTLLATGFLTLIVVAFGLVFLIIPGIYLALGYSLAEQLVCDQGLSAWKAMETSRRAIHHKWWRVLGLGLLVGLLTAVSALGLLIPLIWTIPWLLMTTAVLYRRIFYAPVPGVTTAGPPPAPATPMAPA
jgi:uncharacterized membrane protein